MRYRQEITQSLTAAAQRLFGDAVAGMTVVLQRPAEEGFGDFASSLAMALGKKMGQSPMEVAQKLCSEVAALPFVERAEAVKPGFINITLRPKAAQQAVVSALELGDRFGANDVGRGKRVVVEYSSPNIAKPMHIGHIRSTIIGQALYNIYKFLGWETIGDNHLGDWGTQFGKLLVMYKKEHGEKVVDLTLEDLTRMYVAFHAAAEGDPALEDAARAETKKLQDGDAVNRALWQHFTAVSMKDFGRVYDLLNVHIDNAHGESFYDAMFEGVIALMIERGVAKESDGALITEFDPATKLPPMLLRKADGAALYSTSDIATIIWRKENWQPDKVLYVVSNEQALHFAQLFELNKILGTVPPESLAHIKFGMILGSDGKKFSTRRGGVVNLYDLLQEAISRAQAVAEKQNPDASTEEKKQIAQTVGVASVVYNDLSQNRVGDIRFDWDTMLSLTGNSAPYLLYTYARLRSILRKAGEQKPSAEYLGEEELRLARHFLHFGDVAQQAADANSPHLIATYCFELANAVNSYYERVPVLKAAPAEVPGRLAIVAATAQVIKNCLALLNIEVLERM